MARARRGISVLTMPLFEAHRWRATLGGLEIDEIKTVPHVPVSHPFVERLIRTLRRKFLDHVLFWNARDLERKLADFTTYYNAARVHAGLDGHTPSGFARGHPGARAQPNKVRWMSHCRGLVLAARGSVTKNSRDGQGQGAYRPRNLRDRRRALRTWGRSATSMYTSDRRFVQGLSWGRSPP